MRLCLCSSVCLKPVHLCDRSRGQKALEDDYAKPQAQIVGKNLEDIRNLAPVIFMDED